MWLEFLHVVVFVPCPRSVFVTDSQRCRAASLQHVCLFILSFTDDHSDTILTHGDLGSVLGDMYDTNSDENIVSQFNINSNYYEVDEITSPDHATYDYKYKVLHVNIQGLLSSMEGLNILLNRFESNNISLDFILLCETFLHGDNLDYSKICAIPGYEFVHASRTNKQKGGVGIYVHKKHEFNIRQDLSLFIEGEFETIFIEVESRQGKCTNKCRKTLIGEIYRIPNTSLPASVERYDNIISKLTSHSSYDIIVGTDSNLDLLKIQEHKPTSDFFDNCVSSGLIPVITKPTRITHNTATLIDNLYINLQDNHIHSGIITTKLSDHLPIFAFYGKSLKYKPEPVSYQTRDLGDSNLLQLKQKLERYDWTFLHNLDSNAAYEKFLELLTAELNSAAPLKRINILPTNVIREPWLTKGIIKSSKTLDKLYNKTLNKQKDHITHQEFRS